MLETQAGPVVPLTTKTVEERFADAQASARRLGSDPSLKWIYDVSDELHGASCGDVTFSREELLQLSRSSCWAGSAHSSALPERPLELSGVELPLCSHAVVLRVNPTIDRLHHFLLLLLAQATEVRRRHLLKIHRRSRRRSRRLHALAQVLDLRRLQLGVGGFLALAERVAEERRFHVAGLLGEEVLEQAYRLWQAPLAFVRLRQAIEGL
eukprot:scaffold44388_cov63-Phaeocystis_antarctica.AAC.16